MTCVGNKIIFLDTLLSRYVFENRNTITIGKLIEVWYMCKNCKISTKIKMKVQNLEYVTSDYQ